MTGAFRFRAPTDGCLIVWHGGGGGGSAVISRPASPGAVREVFARGAAPHRAIRRKFGRGAEVKWIEAERGGGRGVPPPRSSRLERLGNNREKPDKR